MRSLKTMTRPVSLTKAPALAASIAAVASLSSSAAPQTTDMTAGTIAKGTPAHVAQAHHQSTKAHSSKHAIMEWFSHYDQIRKDAEMSVPEKLLAARVMKVDAMRKVHGKDRAEAEHLLHSMIARYKTAEARLKALPSVPETQPLHQGYEHYFKEATALFQSYLSLSGHHGNTHITEQSLRSQREKLKSLDRANKALDGQIRDKYDIPKFGKVAKQLHK